MASSSTPGATTPAAKESRTFVIAGSSDCGFHRDALKAGKGLAGFGVTIEEHSFPTLEAYQKWLDEHDGGRAKYGIPEDYSTSPAVVEVVDVIGSARRNQFVGGYETLMELILTDIDPGRMINGKLTTRQKGQIIGGVIGTVLSVATFCGLFFGNVRPLEWRLLLSQPVAGAVVPAFEARFGV